MKRSPRVGWLASVALGAWLVATGAVADARFDRELHAIQQAWAVACYETPAGEARVQALESLHRRAAALAAAHPERADALVWEGIVLTSEAGARGGLGALKYAKQARERLEASSLDLDPATVGGSAYASLGTLYHKVPGFPVGFGSDAKAEQFFARALEINPAGIDVNYFYGEFLLDEGRPEEAAAHLERALAAPDRPGRALADRGRREETRALLAKARSARS